MRKNQKKQQLKLDSARKFVEQEEKMMKLEKSNSILQIELKKNKPNNHRNVTTTPHFLKQHQNKSSSILLKFKTKITIFKRYDLIIRDLQLGAGVFGEVREGHLKSINQKVAVKILSSKLSPADIRAEAMVALEMSGHPNFVFLFGLIQPNFLIFEFIGSCENAPTIRHVITNCIPLNFWKDVCLDLVRAIHHLHVKQLLHNDLHTQNVLLRECRYVKIIDFGKVSLIENPVVYSIKPGTPTHTKYNNVHKHLAYELRNKPGTPVTPQTDIYSLGYIFNKIGEYVRSEKLILVASSMLKKEANDRPSLPSLLVAISKF